MGANIRQFALEINNVFPEAMIYSYEPLRSAYAKLIKTAKKFRNFKAYNIALGEQNGFKKIYRNKYSPSSSILEMADLHVQAYPFTREVEAEQIIIKRLDDVLSAENLNKEILVKIDAQGYEDKVISGGLNILKKSKVVICEVSFYELYKGQLLFDEMLHIFAEFGFKYRGSINPAYHPQNGMPLYSDGIFIRETR